MKKISLIVLVNLLFFACKKNDLSVNSPTEKEKLIIANTWEIKYFNLTNFKFGNFPTNVEYTKNQIIKPILSFDKVRITFKKDFSLSAIGASGNSVYSGKWYFLANETKINITDSGLPGLDGETDVIKLTDDILVLQGSRRLISSDTTKSNLYLEMIPLL